MAQQFGLGRGLSSLIPQKKKTDNNAEDKKITEPKEDFNYFGVSSASKGASPTSQGSVNLAAKKEDSAQSGVAAKGNNISEIEIFRIVPNPHQPRMRFDEEKLKELADSIKEHGIIQPLVVSKNDGDYEVIAGERRLQAAKLAGLKTVPVILREASGQQKLELAIIENIQRHDLDVIEEAKSFKKLMEEFDLSQEDVATKVGKSRSAVANKIRLLNLPVEFQRALIEGKISEGHAKLLLAIPNPERQKAFYDMIIKNNLTVRQMEDKTREVSVRTHKRSFNVDPEIKQIEDELSQKLGTKIKLTKSGGGGRIMIEYYSKEELDNILSKIK